MDLKHIQSYFNVNFKTAEKDMLEYICPSIEQNILIRFMRLGLSVLFINQNYFFCYRNIVWIKCSHPILRTQRNSAIVQSLIKRNIYNEAVSDFHMAKSFMKDGVRLGNKYLFSAHYRTILRYTDICRIYQYIHKLNFHEVSRKLQAVDSSGKIWILCELEPHMIFTPKTNETADKKLMEVISFMLSKNDRIIVGYIP